MGGEMVYKVYRALTTALSPLLYLHLRWRTLRRREHPLRWTERLGRPSFPRPSGPLLWFHAVSLGEAVAALPVIKHCNEHRPKFNILLTTTRAAPLEIIRKRLPSGVICQLAPFDTPIAINSFLAYWKPNAVMLMESELWPNLIMGASGYGIPLALLNARMSKKSFKAWSGPVGLPLISLLLSKFSLITPLSGMQAIHFQLLQAPPFVINFCGDLKLAVEGVDISIEELKKLDDLQLQLVNKRVWMASSIHRGEEEVMLRAHEALRKRHPDLIIIIVPRHPQHGQRIASELQRQGVGVALRSRNERLTHRVNIYIADTLGELRYLYRLTRIAVIGGSFLPGLSGHNISEAAAAGCAVLTGHHVGHFSQMILEMQRLNPFSVAQVSGEGEFVEALGELLGDVKVLEAHCTAAKQAFHALSSGVVMKTWDRLQFHIFRHIQTTSEVDALKFDVAG